MLLVFHFCCLRLGALASLDEGLPVFCKGRGLRVILPPLYFIVLVLFLSNTHSHHEHHQPEEVGPTLESPTPKRQTPVPLILPVTCQALVI